MKPDPPVTKAVGGTGAILAWRRDRDGDRLRDRVVAREIKTIFASRYTAEISLAEAVSPDVIRAYAKHTTGEKYLIAPNAPPI